MNYSGSIVALQLFIVPKASVTLSYWLWVIYTGMTCLWDLEKVLSCLLLVCYETRIVHFVYQPIKSLPGICGVCTV